jgi:hypothetical protein
VDEENRFLEIYEKYEYQMTRYDSVTREVDVFTEYKEMFLKLKAEARGYPNWVRRQTHEKRYIE